MKELTDSISYTESVETKSYQYDESNFYTSDIRAHGLYFKHMDKPKRNEYLKLKFGLENKYTELSCFSFFRRKKRIIKYFPILNQIVTYLHAKDALFVEGITRSAGRIARSDEVRKNINEAKIIDCKKYTPFELINGVKMFVFKDLNGVFNEEAFYIIRNLDVSKLENMSILFINCLVSIMEVDYGYLFIYYLKCLGFMAKMEHKTRMNPKALSIIFTPIFIGEKKFKKSSIEEIRNYVLIFEKIIENFK